MKTVPVFRRVCIESPFGGPTKEVWEKHLRYLRACMKDSLAKGEAPYASHGLYTQEGVLNDWNPDERKLGIAAGLAWKHGAHATIVYADLGITPGMQQGIEAAGHLKNFGAWSHAIEFRLLGGDWSVWLTPEEIKKQIVGVEEKLKGLSSEVAEALAARHRKSSPGMPTQPYPVVKTSEALEENDDFYLPVRKPETYGDG